MTTESGKLRVAVVIPTYERQSKLERCLKSLGTQTYKNFDTFVYCDANDKQTFDWLCSNKELKEVSKVRIISLASSRKYVIGNWNDFFTFQYGLGELLEAEYDAVLWSVDDVEWLPNSIEKAVECMITNFPDTDGVVGIKQECPGHPEYTFKWYGQCLIGRKFIERYKDVEYKVCCPDYNHFFQDEELWQYASSLGKFVNCEQAVLYHYHPGFIKSEMDDTHPIVRGSLFVEDRQTYSKRKISGYVWGKSWELINKR